MSRRGHFPSFDWDCDESYAEPEPRSASPVVHRKIRERSVTGEPELEAAKQAVECPFRDEWPTLEACLGCTHFRGFSLDPTGQDSFVSCAQTEDVVCPLPKHASARSKASRTSVVELMSDPVCVREHITAVELANLFRDLGISGAPVVDETGKPVGVVSKTDLVEESASRIETSRITVGEIMTPVVFSLLESASVAEAAALMAKRGVHRVPIVSRSGRIVGLLTALDLARWLAAPEAGTTRGAPCPAAL